MSERLSLFHGTTLDAAEQIRAEGWLARDLIGMVDELAAKHEVLESDVIDDLRHYNRFMLVEKDRGQVASFTANYETAAGRWAQRAPEVEWDALWAIWRTKHSGKTEMYDWNLDVPGHAWVLEQMSHEKPAVVEVALTVDELFGMGAMVGGFAHGPLRPEHLPLLPGLPESRSPCRSTRAPRSPSTSLREGWDGTSSHTGSGSRGCIPRGL